MSANSYNNFDRQPSDADSSTPTSPASKYNEVDYRPSTNDQSNKKIKLYGPREENPDLDVQPVVQQPRVSFMGVVLRALEKGFYQVLRQDGLILTAFTYGDDREYDSIQVGENCTIIAGPLVDQWLIHGSPRRTELDTICVSNGTKKTTNNKVKVVLDTSVTHTNKDAGNIKHELNGTISLIKGVSALYQITINATVRRVEEGEDSESGSSCGKWVDVITGLTFNSETCEWQICTTKVKVLESEPEDCPEEE
jgi:hypothetical protein